MDLVSLNVLLSSVLLQSLNYSFCKWSLAELEKNRAAVSG